VLRDQERLLMMKAVTQEPSHHLRIDVSHVSKPEAAKETSKM